MTFAWEGFSFNHPEEWAPVTISGTRDEGYARIASSGRLAAQARWKKASSAEEAEGGLKKYLGRLEKDARKLGAKFEGAWESHDGFLTYHYSGSGFGRGACLFGPRTQRVFFLEVASTKNDRLAGPYRELIDSFQEGDEHWAILGLSIRLPGSAKVERKAFLAGKTELVLANRRARVEAQRWGFGEQLIDRHGLEPWSRAAMAMPKAAITSTHESVALEQPSRMKPSVYAIVKYQKDLNQLTTLKVTTRDPLWRPNWDWLI